MANKSRIVCFQISFNLPPHYSLSINEHVRSVAVRGAVSNNQLAVHSSPSSGLDNQLGIRSSQIDSLHRQVPAVLYAISSLYSTRYYKQYDSHNCTLYDTQYYTHVAICSAAGCSPAGCGPAGMQACVRRRMYMIICICICICI